VRAVSENIGDVSDDDYLVSNTIGFLVDDLGDDARYGVLADVERAAVLSWVLDGLIRGDGIQGWIESLGQRSDDAVAALRTLGAQAHAALLARALALFPSRASSDAETRLSSMGSWTTEDVDDWRELEEQYLDLIKDDDLIDNYFRPFILAHPDAFPQTVEEL
jgi:Domain of unknown function (DUF4375)